MNIKILKHNFYKFFTNYHLIILGIIMFSIFVFFKFVRQRAPRDIPFNLMPLGFFILIYICCIFAFIVWTLVRPYKKPHENVTIIVNAFFEPLNAFDNLIKKLSFVQKYYPKILVWIANKGIYIFKTPIFEIISFFIPRILLLAVFILDIFYFSKLEYIYYFLVPCGLLLFFRRYFIYSLNKLKNQYIELLKIDIKGIDTDYEFGIHPSELEPDYDPNDPDNDEIPPYMSLEVEVYVDYYCRCKMYRNEEPIIESLSMTSTFYNKCKSEINYKNKSKFEVHKEQKLLLHTLIKKALSLTLIHEYILLSNNNVLFKQIKIVIYTLYLISWLYILVSSFHTLSIPKLITFINSTWRTYPEPFSDIELFTIKKASYMKIIKFFGF